ncbi:MAG: acyltransferase [Prevotella sp.]|nr:acyltransferase [Bacteroides sp.]MCM1366674.1 acyltransferase [Prevotella sp.]
MKETSNTDIEIKPIIISDSYSNGENLKISEENVVAADSKIHINMRLGTSYGRSKGSGFLQFIAYLQVIGIILVVFGHSFHEYPDGVNGNSLLVTKMMHNFRMPLFIFVSGFLMMYTCFIGNHKRGFKKFTQSKIKRLLLPYLILSLVTFIPRTMMSGMSDDAINLTMNDFYKSMFICGEMVIPFFWFLQASFVLLVASHGCISLGRRYKIPDIYILFGLYLLFVVLTILPYNYTAIWSFNKVCLYGMFFELGAIYAKYFKSIDKIIKWEHPLLFIIFATLWACSYLYFIDTPLVQLSSYFGIFMCISFAKWLVSKDFHFLDHLVGANYIIFLLSWYFNIVSQQILSHLIVLPWWVYSLLSLLTGIYIPWYFYRLMLRHRENRAINAIAFLLGQNLKR